MARRWFQGELVSKSWDRVLTEAWHDGVRFQLNDGRRTMKMQRARVKRYGLYHPTRNPTGAAKPSPTAPHIRKGRPDHALDVDTVTPSGGQRELRAYLARNGVEMVQTVSSEPWHLEARSAIALVRFARKCHKAQKRRAKRK